MSGDFHPKTAAQQVLEARYGRPIEDVLRERYESGLTLQQVADELGISRVTLATWMARAGIPTRTVVSRTAEAVA